MRGRRRQAADRRDRGARPPRVDGPDPRGRARLYPLPSRSAYRGHLESRSQRDQLGHPARRGPRHPTARAGSADASGLSGRTRRGFPRVRQRGHRHYAPTTAARGSRTNSRARDGTGPISGRGRSSRPACCPHHASIRVIAAERSTALPHTADGEQRAAAALRQGIPGRTMPQNTGAQARRALGKGFSRGASVGIVGTGGSGTPGVEGVGECRQVEVTAEVAHLCQSRQTAISAATWPTKPELLARRPAATVQAAPGHHRTERSFDRGDDDELGMTAMRTQGGISERHMSPASSPTMTTTSTGPIQPGGDGAATSGTSRRGGMGDDDRADCAAATEPPVTMTTLRGRGVASASIAPRRTTSATARTWAPARTAAWSSPSTSASMRDCSGSSRSTLSLHASAYPSTPSGDPAVQSTSGRTRKCPRRPGRGRSGFATFGGGRTERRQVVETVHGLRTDSHHRFAYRLGQRGRFLLLGGHGENRWSCA